MCSADPQRSGPDSLQSVEELPADLRAKLEHRWRTATRVHQSLALPFDAFVFDLIRLWRRGKQRLGLAADAAALDADISRLHCEDLYLARLCERGDESAWRTFATRYEPDLRRVLRRHAGAQEAEQLASAVIADSALPPPRKRDRTQLGSYEASGPLWAWLATIATRKLRKKWRRREAPLEAAESLTVPVSLPGAALDERAEAFLMALRGAWEVLEPREALALQWKHRDGLSQRNVAQLLNASEPTVSRIVQRAVSKIRGHLRGALPELPHEDGGLWTRLEAALSNHLATLPPAPHLRVDEP